MEGGAWGLYAVGIGIIERDGEGRRRQNRCGLCRAQYWARGQV